MATDTSNIDDLLIGGVVNSQHPEADVPELHEPEESYEEKEQEAQDLEDRKEQDEQNREDEPEDEDNIQKSTKDTDDYGNEKPAPRTYTQDEVNEMFRKRFKNSGQEPPTVQQQQHVQQQVANNFEYNPDSGDNWQQQLEQFVEQTVSRMSQKQMAQQESQREAQAEAQFRDKFTSGMTKFPDFYEVVSQQPVNDAMTLALRAVNDPASFIYAASKRHPAELQRISQLRDPYTQIAEMGKLEERMRKSAQGTTAPRPIGRNSEDAPIKFKEKNKETSIEDLIASSEAKKLAKLKQRRAK